MKSDIKLLPPLSLKEEEKKKVVEIGIKARAEQIRQARKVKRSD